MIIRLIGSKGKKISIEQYKEIMKYAKEKEVRLSRIEQFDGSMETVKEFIDDVSEISINFPKIKKGKKVVVQIIVL